MTKEEAQQFVVDNIVIRPFNEDGVKDGDFNFIHRTKALILADRIFSDELCSRYEAELAYVKAYGFETTLSYLWSSSTPDDFVRYRAFAVNLDHITPRVFELIWKKECIACSGSGKAYYYHDAGDHFGAGTAPNSGYRDCQCANCGGTGHIEPYDILVPFIRRADRKWNVSICSTKPEIDCEVIAKVFGGDGTKSVAGFQCEHLPFEY